MGAETFFNYGAGKDAKEAFHALVQEAQWECGHGGYTGTIAEKGSFKVFEPPAGMSARTFVRKIEEVDFNDAGPDPNSICLKDLPDNAKQVILNAARVYDDKWGPAVCVPVGTEEVKELKECIKPKKGLKLFLFCGWASS